MKRCSLLAIALLVEETVVQNDQVRILHVFKCPLFDKSGAICGVGGIATDITDKIQHQQKLMAAKLRAEAAEQLQEQFLANMSHEIRTPMNGVMGMANILGETPLSEEQREYLNIIIQSSNKLLLLINNILDVSKIKAGKLVLEQTDFSLKEELESVVAPFQLKCREQGLDFALMNDTPSSLFILGDRLRLHQVLTNLLSNALKFTDKGSILLEVCSTSLNKEGVTLQFSVRDSGVGIPLEQQGRIFDSFVQADSGITRKYGGTGLGLSITRQLVEMQGGKVWVESTPGEGTTFSFTLFYPMSNKVPETEKMALAPSDYSGMEGKRVLVVEDNDVNQKVVVAYLKKAMIDVDIANNGREAVNLLEDGLRYDLIIMDLQMPMMDGFQTTAYIRQKLELATPIIAMTASALRNEKMKCFELGMNEYLTKPFEPVDLFRQLRRFLLRKTEGSGFVEYSVPVVAGTYNLSYLHEMDDHEYFCEVLDLFLSTTPVLVEEIKTDVLYENWESVYAKTHKLKSSLSILRMDEMLKLAAAIELQAKEKVHLEKIDREILELEEKLGVIRPLIEAELSEAKAKLTFNQIQ